MLKRRFDCRSIGVVIYGDVKMYSINTKENNNIHFKNDKKIIFLSFLKVIYEKIGDRGIVDAVVGHEHGDKLSKCHLQIYLKFSERIQQNLEPGYFECNGETCLYMMQTAKCPNALKNYCKKENDYLDFSFNGIKISDILKKENANEIDIVCKKNVYKSLLSEKNLERKNIIDLFKMGNSIEKRDFMLYGKKIIDNYDIFIRTNNTNILKFEWKFPKHMLDFISEIHPNTELNKKMNESFKVIYDWFKRYCNENQERKKALFLFSIEGAKGKSYFARNLVPQIVEGDSPYYVYCRGTLDGKEFEKKKIRRN